MGGGMSVVSKISTFHVASFNMICSKFTSQFCHCPAAVVLIYVARKESWDMEAHDGQQRYVLQKQEVGQKKTGCQLHLQDPELGQVQSQRCDVIGLQMKPSLVADPELGHSYSYVAKATTTQLKSSVS